MNSKRLLIALLLLLASCGSSPTEEEKIEVWNNYIDTNVVITDTIIRFELTKTELTLEFKSPPQFDTWIASISIIDSNNRTLYSTSKDENDQLDTIKFVNGKLKIEGFNLNQINPKNCSVFLFGAPTIPNKLLWSRPGNELTFMMNEAGNGPGILTPWKQFYGVRYVSFDEEYLNSLSEELQIYCRLRQTEAYFMPEK